VVIDVLQALDDNWREGKRYYANKAVEALKPEERILIPLPDSQGLVQPTACVYKSGVFHLIGNSRKPSALKFQEWLRREVLPEIDERGSYTAPGAVVRAPAGVAVPFKQWGGRKKKEAGRILDGRTWDEFPVPRLSS
jgi:prophage antirepressor-like protein